MLDKEERSLLSNVKLGDEIAAHQLVNELKRNGTFIEYLDNLQKDYYNNKALLIKAYCESQIDIWQQLPKIAFIVDVFVLSGSSRKDVYRYLWYLDKIYELGKYEIPELDSGLCVNLNSGKLENSCEDFEGVVVDNFDICDNIDSPMMLDALAIRSDLIEECKKHTDLIIKVLDPTSGILLDTINKKKHKKFKELLEKFPCFNIENKIIEELL